MIKSSCINLDNQMLDINVTATQGCYVEILERIKCQMDAMLSHHSRVIVIRLDLHVNHYEDKNSLLSKFIRKLRKRLTNRYDIKRIGFVWVREIETAKKQHHHLAIMLNANKINYPTKVYDLIDEIWMGWNQPKPFRPKNGYYNLTRTDTDTYQAAFERLSYLAKERGKGYKAKKANDYSTSRIKPRDSPSKGYAG